MKKLILSTLAMASLAFAANAVTNMYVECVDGSVDEYDVDHVTELYYTEFQVVDGVVVTGKEGLYTYVDLGLPSGTKWATYNVGATKPTEYGDYFAWGETKPKEDYSWSTYKWCNGSEYSMTKYCTKSRYGTVDSNKVLDAEDDAATANWGSAWRMPTRKEIEELIKGCSWEWVKDFNGSGVNGRLGTSMKNGATIFLPAAGAHINTDLHYVGKAGYCWSSYLGEDYPNDAYFLTFDDGSIKCYSNYRDYGLSVRAVLEERKETAVTVSGKEGLYTYVDLGLKSGTKWATYNVGASKPAEYGDYFAWGETKPKEDYSWSTYKWCKGSEYSMTKYCTKSYFGTVDNKKVLEAEDDAATANWGSAWRMPTLDEIEELIDGCSWEWVEDFSGTGVNGRLGTSKKNGATIFLPFAGDRVSTDLDDVGIGGFCWSSSLHESSPSGAYDLSFYDGSIKCYSSYRDYGLSVRAVLEERKEYVVNFYDKDGKLIESQRIDAGKSATEVKAPIVDGYDFVGWDDSSFVNVTRSMSVRAVYVKQLPDLYVDVEKGDSVVFRQNGKTGYFIVEEATTAEVKLKVFYGGKSNVVTLSDSYGSFCSAGLQMVNLSSAVNNPSQIVFAKVAKLARIQSPTSSANAVVSSSAPETRFELHSSVFTDQGVTVSGKVGLYTYVDLGLPSGTKWATYNVGATKPTEYGDYFAWGETKPKEDYNWGTYKLCKGTDKSMTKYCTDRYYGTVDNKTVLEAEDDAATANWGSAWRMPTENEIKELVEGCSWEWVKDFNGSGVNGRLGTSKVNGATIFLPAAGCRNDTGLYNAGNNGRYWSSSLYESLSLSAICLNFHGNYIGRNSYYRYYGQSVRAVLR